MTEEEEHFLSIFFQKSLLRTCKLPTFMKNAFIFIAFFLLSFSPQKERYRWKFKLLVDKEGLNLIDNKAEASTIDALDSIERPLNLARQAKRAEVEHMKVTVDAYIIARGREEDGDYHLVLQSMTGSKTLIAEIPSPENDELKNHKVLRNLYSRSRSFIDSMIGEPLGKVMGLQTKRKVKVTGIVFFDKLSHGNGHAMNGVEIHPVLKIE
jgi:hypothetical protein